MCDSAQSDSVPIPYLHKDFIHGSINGDEKWILSRDRAWDSTLIEDLLCVWGGGMGVRLSCRGL